MTGSIVIALSKNIGLVIGMRTIQAIGYILFRLRHAIIYLNAPFHRSSGVLLMGAATLQMYTTPINVALWWEYTTLHLFWAHQSGQLWVGSSLKHWVGVPSSGFLQFGVGSCLLCPYFCSRTRSEGNEARYIRLSCGGYSAYLTPR